MKLVPVLQAVLIVLTVCAILYGVMAAGKLIYSVVGLSALMIGLCITIIADALKPQIDKIKSIKINLSFIKAPVMRAIARLF